MLIGRFLFYSQCLLLAIYLAQAVPQQQLNSNVENNIADIFNTNPSLPTPIAPQPPSRGGIGEIVTPVPFDPSAPQGNFNSQSGRQTTCNCVPYHMCDPSTHTVTVDGTFDGFGLLDLRFGDDDPVCPASVDVCCDSSRTRNTSLTPTPVEQRPNRPRGCGIRNVGGIDFTLVGATQNEAGFGEFPWTVALLHSGNASYFCAGSLIHPQVVLTAVHCVAPFKPGSFIARAGEWDAQTVRERLPFQERGVQRIILHPRYNPRNVANDYALLILTEPFKLGDHINVACLPLQGATPAPGTTCLAAGWGKNKFGAVGTYSVILKRVSLPIVDFTTCQTQLRGTRLGPRFGLDRSFLCAGGQRGIDTCQGDGGAPLVCPIGIPSENRYQQSGIVAWGIGCNDDIPAAYADVSLARNWIDEQMLANGFGTDVYTA